MRILHASMKTLLICTMTCACFGADDTSVSTTDAPPAAEPAEKTSTPKAGGVTVANRHRSGSSEKTTAFYVSKPESSASLFFSASGSTETRAIERNTNPVGADADANGETDSLRSATETGNSTPATRQRLPVTGLVNDSEAVKNELRTATAAVAGTPEASVVPAAFESPANQKTPKVMKVAAEESNPFTTADSYSKIPVLSFDEAYNSQDPAQGFGREFTVDTDEFTQEPQTSATQDFTLDRPTTSSFEPSGSDTAGFTGSDLAPAAIPHTESDGLPSQHTGAQSPQVDVLWVGEGTLNIGQRSQCSLVVTNNGRSLVRNVVVEAAIPPGVDVVQALPAPQSGTSRWSVGDLEPGQEHAIQMIVVPRERGDVALNAFVRFTGYSTSVFAVQEPMLQMHVEGPESVTVGEQAGYVITVHNPGTGIARNVVIEAKVPEGLQHRSGSVPRIDVGMLNPGESRQARLNLSAIAGGVYRLAVRSLADGGLRDEARADVSIAEPRLEVVINGPTVGSMDKPAEYLVLVTNSGNVPSINVRAKYKIPDGFHFVHADRGGVMQEAENLVDWFVGTLQPGESSEYHVTLTPGAAGTALHRAGVMSEHSSATMVSHSMEVKGLPKLSLDIAAVESSAAVGQETVVQIVIRNEGGIAANKVGLFCELPSGLEFVAAAGPSEHLADNGVVIFRSLAGIESGETVTYRVKAQCVRTGDHRIRARVASESLTEPVNGEAAVSCRTAR